MSINWLQRFNTYDRLADEKPSGNVGMPDGVVIVNGSEYCDMLTGPCACGAWHNGREQVDKMRRDHARVNKVLV